MNPETLDPEPRTAEQWKKDLADQTMRDLLDLYVEQGRLRGHAEAVAMLHAHRGSVLADMLEQWLADAEAPLGMTQAMLDN